MHKELGECRDSARKAWQRTPEGRRTFSVKSTLALWHRERRATGTEESQPYSTCWYLNKLLIFERGQRHKVWLAFCPLESILMKWEVLGKINFHLNSCVTLFQKPPSVWEFWLRISNDPAIISSFLTCSVSLRLSFYVECPDFSCKGFFFPPKLEWLINFFSVYWFNVEKINHNSHPSKAIRLLIQVLYSGFLPELGARFPGTWTVVDPRAFLT